MKRFLSIFLALVLLFTIVPINTQAAANTAKRNDILKKHLLYFLSMPQKLRLMPNPLQLSTLLDKENWSSQKHARFLKMNI